MEIHINHSSYLKFISSYAAVAIAVIECANIIEHQMHLEFHLFKYTLVVIAVAFIAGLIYTYNQQKKPDRIRDKILTKYSKWTETENSRYLLHRSELLNLRLLKDTPLPEGFDSFIDHSKHDVRKKLFMLRLLPAINIVMICGILFFAIYYFFRLQINTVTIEKDLPQFLSLVDSSKNDDAFNLGNRLLKDNKNNKIVQDAMNKLTAEIDIISDPPDAKVYRYTSGSYSSSNWEYLGKTPIKKAKVPWTHFTKLRFDAGNNKQYIFSESTWILYSKAGKFTLPLNVNIDTSREAVVLGQKLSLLIPGLDEREAEIGPFVIDRYEVTNEEYQKFVNAGGYNNPKYWDFPTTIKNKTYAFDVVKDLFKDKSGVPGPAGWVSGAFTEGEGRLPVNGISWFEASAYARFTGKKLPSVYHWTRGASVYMGSDIIPVSNFSKSHLKEVGYSKVTSVYGLYDVAGNVREWCTNTSGSDSTHVAILGGSYLDGPFSFNDFFAASPFDRSLANGVRCMFPLVKQDNKALYTEYLYVPVRDFKSLPGVGKETFAVIKGLYDYEKKPLNVVTKEKITTNSSYDVEAVEFNAAYNNERMGGYLYTPKNRTAKSKTIVFFPGANAFNEDIGSLNEMRRETEFLVKQDYAVFIPIFKSTYNRKDDVKNDYPNKSDAWKEHIIMWGKDLKRSIDFLETRQDLDISKLAYYGISWGAAMGSILCAIDDRVKVGLLYVAGFYQQPCQLEVEQYVYAPYVKMPILMLNGKYDFFYPLETSQNPMYELLGTPLEHKKRYVYPTGHNVPEEELVREVLAWLKKYT